MEFQQKRVRLSVSVLEGGFRSKTKDVFMAESGCPIQEDLIRFVNGVLPELESVQVARHVGSCSACQQVTDELQAGSTEVEVLLAISRPLPAVCYLHEPECAAVVASLCDKNDGALLGGQRQEDRVSPNGKHKSEGLSDDRVLQCYGNLLVQAWGMPRLMDRLKANPGEVLKEFGLDPSGAKVRILQPGEPNSLGVTQCTPDSQVELFNEGRKRGLIDIYIPDSPPEDAREVELSDEELMAVAGGWSVSCCSCSPCCC